MSNTPKNVKRLTRTLFLTIDFFGVSSGFFRVSVSVVSGRLNRYSLSSVCSSTIPLVRLRAFCNHMLSSQLSQMGRGSDVLIG